MLLLLLWIAILPCVVIGFVIGCIFFQCRGPYCVGIESYIAETDEDLTFFVSDVIELIERIDDNWLKGRCGGNTGIFPQSFVQIERDLPPSGMQQEPLPGPDHKEDEATSGTTILSVTGTGLHFSCVQYMLW